MDRNIPLITKPPKAELDNVKKPNAKNTMDVKVPFLNNNTEKNHDSNCCSCNASTLCVLSMCSCILVTLVGVLGKR